jgi:hypothetical protein
MLARSTGRRAGHRAFERRADRRRGRRARAGDGLIVAAPRETLAAEGATFG